jgi:hypothetical protein
MHVTYIKNDVSRVYTNIYIYNVYIYIMCIYNVYYVHVCILLILFSEFLWGLILCHRRCSPRSDVLRTAALITKGRLGGKPDAGQLGMAVKHNGVWWCLMSLFMLDQLDQSVQLRNYVYPYVDMILESRVPGLVFSAYYVSALGMLVQRTMWV